MLPAQSALNHSRLFQPWQAPARLSIGSGQQQADFIELPPVSDYQQLRSHRAFDAIQAQFLSEVCELKQLARAYVNQQYDQAIDAFVVKLEAPTDDLFATLLPIYRETRFQIHQLVGRLRENRQNIAHNPQNFHISNYIASVLHDCLDGIDLCPAGVHSRFSRSFLDLEAMLHGGQAGRFYKLRNDVFREFIQAFLWQNQRMGEISIAEGMEVHWFNALYNLYCNNLVLEPIDDPQAITNLSDELLSGFLQRVSVSVSACVILRRIADSWCTRLTRALATVGCCHWLSRPTHGNENTAIGIDALISQLFNPVNSLMGTTTDNPLNLDAVIDLCDSESFHLKRHREKILAWITGHFYRDSSTVFAEVLVCGRSKAFIGSINELFFWVFDYDSSLSPGQACCFAADRHTSLKLTHLLSIDFSTWSAGVCHALLTQAIEQTDEPDEIAMFFLDRSVATQLNAMPSSVRQALSNQLRDKLLGRTSAFREALCHKVCSYAVCCGASAVSGHSLEWLIDTPLLEPVLLRLFQQDIDISQVTRRLDSWQISDWTEQCLRTLLLPSDCRRLFSQAFRLRQARVLGCLLLTGYCNEMAYSLSDCFFNEHRYVSRCSESLINLFACRGCVAGLKHMLALVQQYTLTLTESCQAQAAIINQHCKHGFTPLLNAAMHGHADCLQALLNVPGVDINLVNLDGRTPLHLAALHGNVRCVQVLLQTDNVAINDKTPDGVTPLTSAILRGHLDIVRELLAHASIKVNEGCHRGVTPLQCAAQSGYGEIMQALLAMPDIDVNGSDLFGWTALHKAADAGHQQCVLMLLQVPGIDANAKNRDGWTPLNSAAYRGYVGCVQALLEVSGISINEVNSAGCSPLSHAAQGGHLDCIRLLLAAPGIDVNQMCHSGLTPLSHAVRAGHLETVKAILATENILVNATTNSVTALHYAVHFGHAGIVRMLLQTPGVLVNALQDTGRTPLIAAVEKGHSQCVRELLGASDIDINQPDDFGRTPLSVASRYGWLRCVQLLLQAPGIEVNKPNPFGWVPLHQATKGGHWRCILALLQATGIQVNLLTADGHFALGMAAEHDDLRSLQVLLVAHGIEVNKFGRFGATALHLAANNGHARCIEALLPMRGIEIDNRDHFNLRPLDLAMRSGFRECTRLLQRARTSSGNESLRGNGLAPPIKAARHTLDQRGSADDEEERLTDTIHAQSAEFF